MFKRTKGYLLLTMLVLTGLAGRIHSDTISGKERRQLLQELKHSKSTFSQSIKGLTNKQLDFQYKKGMPSIRDHIYQAVSMEHLFWSKAKSSLQQPGTNLINRFPDQSIATLIHQESLQKISRQKFKNVEDAFSLLKKDRAEQLKYFRTTTENVRIHALPTPVGMLDAYQMVLMNTISLHYCTEQIQKIKTSSDFPN